MSKFVIECPNCGKYAEAKTGFFARKKIPCTCGHTINVRTEKLAARECPHCGNMVVFDQTKGADAKCPVCKEPINTMAEQTKVEEFSCAQCGVRLRTSKAAERYVCPVCDFENDVQERLISEKIKKDGLASIIKYEGDNSTFIWKHPIEDFNYGSQLIVHESQEAIFFRDGQALDLFGPGRYTLETQQLPLLEKVYSLPTDTEGTFHSEVYFINKTVQMAIKWGTPEKVRFIDPLTGTPLELGASGEMNLQVLNSRKLLVKLVGTMQGIAWEEGPGFTKSIQASFRPLISNAVKTNLSSVITMEAIDLLEIDTKGYNQRDVLQAEVQKAYAESIGNMGPAISTGGGGGSSGMLGDIIGLGVGMAAAGAVAPQIGGMLKGLTPQLIGEGQPIGGGQLFGGMQALGDAQPAGAAPPGVRSPARTHGTAPAVRKVLWVISATTAARRSPPPPVPTPGTAPAAPGASPGTSAPSAGRSGPRRRLAGAVPAARRGSSETSVPTAAARSRRSRRPPGTAPTAARRASTESSAPTADRNGTRHDQRTFGKGIRLS